MAVLQAAWLRVGNLWGGHFWPGPKGTPAFWPSGLAGKCPEGPHRSLKNCPNWLATVGRDLY